MTRTPADRDAANGDGASEHAADVLSVLRIELLREKTGKAEGLDRRR